MTDNMKNFMEYVSENEELREKLKSLANETAKDDVIAIAKENGFVITEDDFKAESVELDDDELESISAAGGCGCFISGGGSGDGLICACVTVGGGGITHDRTRCTNAGAGACACYVGGAGATDGCKARS